MTKTRGVEVRSDDVVCACGGKPFIGYTVLSVTDYGEGHEVIYPNPGFPIYSSQISAMGAVPVPLSPSMTSSRSASTHWSSPEVQ